MLLFFERWVETAKWSYFRSQSIGQVLIIVYRIDGLLKRYNTDIRLYFELRNDLGEFAQLSWTAFYFDICYSACHMRKFSGSDKRCSFVVFCLANVIVNLKVRSA